MFNFGTHTDGSSGLSPRQAFALGLATSVLTLGTVGFVLLLVLLFVSR